MHPARCDREIAGARIEEDKARAAAAREAAKTHRRMLPIGTKVSVSNDAFVRLEGVVKNCDGKSALVTFGGSISLQMRPFC